MAKVDIVAISRLPPAQRRIQMAQLFSALAAESDVEQISVLRALIEMMAEKATHEEYLNLCFTDFDWLVDRSDSEVRHFLHLRTEAAAGLPEKWHKRDTALMHEALDQLDKPNQEKILKNLPPDLPLSSVD
ncbi:MAG: hypothetical protein OWS74_05720 [Firmicutes bacterium]|nr:hypothetical protein [Bacillota bacterium]